MSPGTKLRWGILGAAQIARKNWRAIASSGNAIVAAVASRDIATCRQFIADCQKEAPMPATPSPYDSYEDLLAARDIDAVYIPIPTGVRKEWVIRAAEAGKHVLCEKPCAARVADLVEATEACRRKRVQFMDGVMFMHSNRLTRLREILDDGRSVGSLKRITSAFSFRAETDFFTTNIRGDSKLEPHGCVGDLGWYCIRLALWALNWEMPKAVNGRVLARSQKATPGIITDFIGDLIFSKGVSSSFYCSFVTENQQWANLSGDKGYAQLNDFVLPVDGNQTGFELHRYDFQVNGTDFRMVPEVRRITLPEHSHGQEDSQETNMFRNFSEQILSGKLNDEWREIALQTQKVMEQCISAAESMEIMTGH
jgi:predicted dehydrogenase